jgi:hypothetical protein
MQAINPINRMLVAVAFVCAALNGIASDYTSVAVNGELLTQEQLYVLQAHLGTAIPAGSYLLDEQGCWLNLTNNVSGCVGDTSTQLIENDPEQSPIGTWHHYSDATELVVVRISED